MAPSPPFSSTISISFPLVPVAFFPHGAVPRSFGLLFHLLPHAITRHLEGLRLKLNCQCPKSLPVLPNVARSADSLPCYRAPFCQCANPYAKRTCYTPTLGVLCFWPLSSTLCPAPPYAISTVERTDPKDTYPGQIADLSPPCPIQIDPPSWVDKPVDRPGNHSQK